MAALVIDSGSNAQANLAGKPPQVRPCEQFLAASGALPSRITHANSDDHLDHFATSSHKPIVSLSSVIMSSEKPTNSTNGYATQPPSTQPTTTNQSGDSFGHYLSETSKAQISSILADVEKLNDIEKLYLYLQLPDGTCNNESANNDKKKVLYNPFGKKTDTEVIQTYTWIQSHLEEDISVSIPKHEVYEDYRVYCEANKFDKLCVADFGKAMKHIFPHVKPRRLGQRGNSKYCYSGLRKKILVESPELPVLDTSEYKFGHDERDSKKNVLADDVAWNVILDWVEKTFNRKFKSSIDFARHLIETENIDLSKALKNGDKVHSQMVKSYISKASTAKKKDVFSQINKKLQDKKKCDIERTEKSFLSTSAIRVTKPANNFVSPKTINYSKVDGFDNLNIASVSPLKLTVKSEPEETAFSTANSKGQISNTSFTNSSPSIILFPENQVTTNQALSDNGSTLSKCSTSELNHTVSVAANSSTIKYKPIQPKPINQESMAQCFPEADNGHFNSLNIDKRRHSVSTPFNMDAINHKDIECFSFGSELKLVENDKNYKRQMEEKDFQFMTKRRHVSMPEGSKATANSTIENSDLKVNELETEALYDYLNTNTTPSVFDSINSNDNSSLSNSTNSTINDCNKDSFVQIRKLLENHLVGNNMNNFNQDTLPKPHLDNDPMMPNLFADCASKSNSLCSMAKSNYQFADNSNGLAQEMVPTTLENVHLGNCSLVNNLNNNNSQIPPSPNARRRAFSFQPISPRNTPTIPENSALDMNMFNKSVNYNGLGTSQQLKQMNTIAVGPSQPSSENNSPFISPRNTPIPMSSVSRSRNNSGQSNYNNNNNTNNNNYRQTSLPNFDSGVSSISSSPFISPQSTPIPGTARIRALDNSNRNLARVRHSSGPGGPINRSQVANVMIYNRSNSLSPMISGENAFVFSNPNFNSTQCATSVVGSNCNAKFNEDLMNRLNVVSQENKLAVEFGSPQMQFNANNIDNSNFHSKAMNTRQRHFSTPYGGAANTTALMKSEENDSFKMLINRSQSVPLSQMFQSNQFDSLDQQFFAPMCSGVDPGSLSGLDPNLSKSYPTTPLCNDSFKLPHSTSIGTSTSSVVNASLEPNGYLTSPSLDDLLTNTDSIIQSGQDVFVSSVQINQGINSGSNDATSSVDDLNVPSPLMLAKSDRDGLNDLGLISDNVVDDNFQSLAEFRDCDNDFSNLELDNQANAYDDVFKFP